MEIVSAKCRRGSECCSSRLPLKNLMLRRHSILVFLVPETLRYSQDLIAKKNAPMNNSHRALSIVDNDIL